MHSWRHNKCKICTWCLRHAHCSYHQVACVNLIHLLPPLRSLSRVFPSIPLPSLVSHNAFCTKKAADVTNYYCFPYNATCRMSGYTPPLQSVHVRPPTTQRMRFVVEWGVTERSARLRWRQGIDAQSGSPLDCTHQSTHTATLWLCLSLAF